MTSLSCNFSSVSVLLPYDSLPLPELKTPVSNCKEICQSVYGDGNTDLTGIGVSEDHSLSWHRCFIETFAGNYLLRLANRPCNAVWTGLTIRPACASSLPCQAQAHSIYLLAPRASGAFHLVTTRFYPESLIGLHGQTIPVITDIWEHSNPKHCPYFAYQSSSNPRCVLQTHLQVLLIHLLRDGSWLVRILRRYRAVDPQMAVRPYYQSVCRCGRRSRLAVEKYCVGSDYIQWTISGTLFACYAHVVPVLIMVFFYGDSESTGHLKLL